MIELVLKYVGKSFRPYSATLKAVNPTDRVFDALDSDIAEPNGFAVIIDGRAVFPCENPTFEEIGITNGRFFITVPANPKMPPEELPAVADYVEVVEFGNSAALVNSETGEIINEVEL